MSTEASLGGLEPASTRVDPASTVAPVTSPHLPSEEIRACGKRRRSEDGTSSVFKYKHAQTAKRRHDTISDTEDLSTSKANLLRSMGESPVTTLQEEMAARALLESHAAPCPCEVGRTAHLLQAAELITVASSSGVISQEDVDAVRMHITEWVAGGIWSHDLGSAAEATFCAKQVAAFIVHQRIAEGLYNDNTSKILCALDGFPPEIRDSFASLGNVLESVATNIRNTLASSCSCTSRGPFESGQLQFYTYAMTSLVSTGAWEHHASWCRVDMCSMLYAMWCAACRRGTMPSAEELATVLFILCQDDSKRTDFAV